MDAGLIARSALGFLVLHALAWALSENRRTVAWRPVGTGAGQSSSVLILTSSR